MLRKSKENAEAIHISNRTKKSIMEALQRGKPQNSLKELMRIYEETLRLIDVKFRFAKTSDGKVLSTNTMVIESNMIDYENRLPKELRDDFPLENLLNHSGQVKKPDANLNKYYQILTDNKKGGDYIGHLVYYFDGKKIDIPALEIHETYGGRNLGILLIMQVVQYALKDDCRLIYLETAQHKESKNPERDLQIMNRFYSKLGFRLNKIKSLDWYPMTLDEKINNFKEEHEKCVLDLDDSAATSMLLNELWQTLIAYRVKSDLEQIISSSKKTNTQSLYARDNNNERLAFTLKVSEQLTPDINEQKAFQLPLMASIKVIMGENIRKDMSEKEYVGPKKHTTKKGSVKASSAFFNSEENEKVAEEAHNITKTSMEVEQDTINKSAKISKNLKKEEEKTFSSSIFNEKRKESTDDSMHESKKQKIAAQIERKSFSSRRKQRSNP